MIVNFRMNYYNFRNHINRLEWILFQFLSIRKQSIFKFLGLCDFGAPLNFFFVSSLFRSLSRFIKWIQWTKNLLFSNYKKINVEKISIAKYKFGCWSWMWFSISKAMWKSSNHYHFLWNKSLSRFRNVKNWRKCWKQVIDFSIFLFIFLIGYYLKGDSEDFYIQETFVLTMQIRLSHFPNHWIEFILVKMDRKKMSNLFDCFSIDTTFSDDLWTHFPSRVCFLKHNNNIFIWLFLITVVGINISNLSIDWQSR